MASKKLSNIIIVFNITMVFVLFLLSQITLVKLNGMIVEEIGIVINFRNPNPIMGLPPPPAKGAMPNFPLFIFIFTLIINFYFIIKLRRK